MNILGQETSTLNLVAAVSGDLTPTERRIAEAVLAEVERLKVDAKLQETQRLDSLAVLAGGIAHDFNNLLTVISSYCTVLLKEIDEDNPWHLDITEIQKAGHRGAVLTRQLLAFSRKQILQPKVMNLGRVVAGMENVLGRLDTHVVRTGFRVYPVVGLVLPPLELRLDRNEVDEAFEVPLSFFLRPGAKQRHSRMFRGKERHFFAYPYGRHYIWGATAGMLGNLAEILNPGLGDGKC